MTRLALFIGIALGEALSDFWKRRRALKAARQRDRERRIITVTDYHVD